ncbi:YncE family protein, partial [Patulibacter sp. S7RM1-6]
AGGAVAVGAELGNELQLVRGDRVVARRRVALQPGGLATLDGGRVIAVVAVKERVLELFDSRTLRRLASAPAGVGPTHIACRPELVCYVADTTGRAILIFEWDGKELQLTRRQYLSSEPYGIALDSERERLWVTLPRQNRLVELRARRGSRTGRTFPTVQQPQTVAVDAGDGTVWVTGATHGELQRLRP